MVWSFIFDVTSGASAWLENLRPSGVVITLLSYTPISKWYSSSLAFSWVT